MVFIGLTEVNTRFKVFIPPTSIKFMRRGLVGNPGSRIYLSGDADDFLAVMESIEDIIALVDYQPKPTLGQRIKAVFRG
jgi:hypothetical protein